MSFIRPALKRTPLATFNPERRERKRRRNFSGPFEGYDHAETIRKMRCAIFGMDFNGKPHRCLGRTEAAHVRARGMGGAKGKWSDLVPLCGLAHRLFDVDCANRSDTFKVATGVDLRELADELAEGARSAE